VGGGPGAFAITPAYRKKVAIYMLAMGGLVVIGLGELQWPGECLVYVGGFLHAISEMQILM
jgi:hypothetical protein